MELPHLGLHCGVESCSKLDFLPFECDCCHKTLCQDHRNYEDHNCTDAHVKDVHVPICPLCNQPIPVKYGQDPNLGVNEHIMRDCQEQQKRKLYTNKCSFPGCKKKELVPVTCSTCHRNFCLKHRFEDDHQCSTTSSSANSTSKPAATSSSGGSRRDHRGGTASGGRGGGKRPQASLMSQIGADLNRERQERLMNRGGGGRSASGSHYSSNTATQQDEDEALALALAMSEQDNDRTPSHSTTHTSTNRGPTSGSTNRGPTSSSTNRGPTSGSTNRGPTISSNNDTTIEEDEALARAIAASLNDHQHKPSTTNTSNTATNSSQNNTDKSSNCVIS